MINVEDRQDYREIVRDIAQVVNKYRLEQESQTPEHILAEYMLRSLSDFNRLMQDRDYWYYGSADPKSDSNRLMRDRDYWYYGSGDPK